MDYGLVAGRCKLHFVSSVCACCSLVVTMLGCDIICVLSGLVYCGLVAR